MFRYFRINDPYRLVGLLVIFLMVSLPIFIDPPPLIKPELKSLVIGEKISQGNIPYAELIESTAPFTQWLYGLMDLLFGRNLLIRHIIVFIFIYLQSAYWGIILINKKSFTESTYLPSFIFLILFYFSFDTLALTGELMASMFLLLAINNLFKEIEFRTQRDETVLNLGVFISVATLFNFSCIVFLPAALIILAIYSRSNARIFLLLGFGFLLPHILLITAYYLFGNAFELWRYYYLPNLEINFQALIGAKTLWVLGAIPLFYLFLAMVMLNRESRFTKYQSQLIQIMFWWMLFGGVQMVYSKDLRPQSFITLIPSLSLYFTHFLLTIRRKRFAELNLWILFVGILGVSLSSRYNYIEQISYTDLVVATHAKDSKWKNKRLLVLDDQVSLYRDNSLATPFFNWRLSKEIFEAPDYYENVILVAHAFQQDPPEVIIDPDNHMRAYRERIPYLKGNYTLIEEGVYQRKINN